MLHFFLPFHSKLWADNIIPYDGSHELRAFGKETLDLAKTHYLLLFSFVGFDWQAVSRVYVREYERERQNVFQIIFLNILREREMRARA